MNTPLMDRIANRRGTGDRAASTAVPAGPWKPEPPMPEWVRRSAEGRLPAADKTGATGT